MGFDIDEAIDEQNWKKESSVSLRTKDGNSRLLVSEMKVLIFTAICIY